MTTRRAHLLLALSPLLVLASALSLAGCGAASLLDSTAAVVPDGGPGTYATMSSGERVWAEEVLLHVNEERQAAGLLPLAWDERAAEVAYAHAWDMDVEGFFDHVNPQGLGPEERLAAAGFALTLVGENIARGVGTPEAVVRAWMESPGHEANILTPGFTRAGVGVHTGPADGPWWTLDLFRPEGE